MIASPATTGRLRSCIGALLAALLAVAWAGDARAEKVDAKLVFWRTSRIATPIMGRIASLPVRVGDRVKKGDILAEIDTQQLKGDLAVAENALELARADLVTAEARLTLEMTEYARAAKLKDSPAFSGARFEDSANRVAVAKADVETARARVSTRQAEVARRQLDVKLATIEAPFDGIVVRHLLTVGGLVSQENPHILVLVDDTSPEIVVEAPIDVLARLPVGREVDFSIGDGPHARARVRSVTPAGEPDAGTRAVRLDPLSVGTQFSDALPVTVYIGN